MSKLPISAFIIALNEGDRIGVTIASLRDLVDEIVVVDGGSSDDTVKAATDAGASVFTNPWPGYGLQKRFGEDQCRHKWLLNLDADEAISPALAEEIRAVFAGTPENYSGYTMRVCHILPGESDIPKRTQVNTCLRLYHRDKGRFSDSPVHDSVILTEGRTAALSAPVLHRSYRSFTHALDKVNRYSAMQADDMVRRGQGVATPRIYAEFFVNFFKAYFLRGYVFRGTRGFNYAMLFAFSRFARLAKWYELTHGEKKP